MQQNPAEAPITGYDGPADESVQTYWLNVAWRALQAEDRSIATRLANGTLGEDIVADVVTAAARRVLRNPDNLVSESGSIDDYNESVKYAESSEDIYFTAAELRRLAPPEAGILAGWSGSMRYA